MNSLPGVYRQCAVCYTDFWSAYELVFPDSRHKSVGKETGLTAYIERLNILCVKEFLGWSERLYPFLKS